MALEKVALEESKTVSIGVDRDLAQKDDTDDADMELYSDQDCKSKTTTVELTKQGSPEISTGTFYMKATSEGLAYLSFDIDGEGWSTRGFKKMSFVKLPKKK